MITNRKILIVIVLIFIIGGVYYSTIRRARDDEHRQSGEFQNPTSAPWTNGPAGPPPGQARSATSE